MTTKLTDDKQKKFSFTTPKNILLITEQVYESILRNERIVQDINRIIKANIPIIVEYYSSIVPGIVDRKGIRNINIGK